MALESQIIGHSLLVVPIVRTAASLDVLFPWDLMSEMTRMSIETLVLLLVLFRTVPASQVTCSFIHT